MLHYKLDGKLFGEHYFNKKKDKPWTSVQSAIPRRRSSTSSLDI